MSCVYMWFSNVCTRIRVHNVYLVDVVAAI
jgi:hypothetical protein